MRERQRDDLYVLVPFFGDLTLEGIYLLEDSGIYAVIVCISRNVYFVFRDDL